ncbi:acyl dehydratase [Hephaestia caeni]|uniref:Acyl dehydratase n=1 Tax=Hephaestia caeni TaxID=645617 RepID=A0A397PCG1_9SPHN|nr:MaoC family dehydratase [Hephaestia caeni]RIA43824.1 acyl dehydratase [Hephaestia caeni]
MERPSGKYYEELEVGHVFRHPLTRTVTETDNLLITTLTMNTQLLHLDEEFAKEHSVSGTRLVNSIFTLGLVVGVGVSDVSNGTTVGNLGFKDISFPAPVSIGDTLRAETEVLSKRESKSRPNAGIVEFEHRGYNQKGTLIAKIHRIALMMKVPTDG